MNMIKKKLRESSTARWAVLAFVSFTMLTGYIISDVMAPLKPMLESQLGWESAEYGLFTSGYGLFNIFLFMLIIGGIILDRKGARFTGILAVGLMLAGTALKYWAIDTDMGDATVSLAFGSWQVFSAKAQVFWAMLGFALFGVGLEMIGITATKVMVKWFKGHSLALAMGLNVAAGRIGTGLALLGAYPYAKWTGSVSAPVALCFLLLIVGLLVFMIYVMMDRRLDRENAADGIGEEQSSEEDKFKFSDIVSIVKIRGFWYITILCLLFYSAVFPFLKYATDFMVNKFGVGEEFAGIFPALIPFGNILLTPLFGGIYDKKGRGATIMILGAVMLFVVHLLFSVPMLNTVWLAVALMLMLGAAFSLVPSAMWPSVPKIIPYNQLGTAYSIIFWIQNWGLSGMPLLIGYVLDKYCIIGQQTVDGVVVTRYDYTIPMMIFAGLGILSIVCSLLLRREDARKKYGLELPNISAE